MRPVTGQLADAIGDFTCLVFLFGGICQTASCPVTMRPIGLEGGDGSAQRGRICTIALLYMLVVGRRSAIGPSCPLLMQMTRAAFCGFSRLVV